MGGNRSMLTSVCEQNEKLSDGVNEWEINTPNSGNLLLRVLDNSGGDSMMAVYKTLVELRYEDGWGITTNVSCLSRLLFNRTDTFVDFDGIDNYDISLLEWYCDLNVSSLGVVKDSAFEAAWMNMISLPATMSAIVLDSSFDAIMLFD